MAPATEGDEDDEHIVLERRALIDRLGPGQAERLLELRAHVLAKPAETGRTIRSPLEVVAFKAGAGTFAVAMASVACVREVGKSVRVPGTTPAVAGVIVHQGDLVAAVDLAQLFEGRPIAPGAQTRLVMLERGSEVIALLADQILGVRTIDSATLAAPPTTFPPELTRLVTGVDESGAAVLSLHTLAEALFPRTKDEEPS